MNTFILRLPLLGSSLLTLVLATLPAPLVAAEPKAEVSDAIKKLGQEPNYSWSVTQKTTGSETAARRDGSIEGKADKDGVVVVKTTTGENTYQAAFKAEKVIVNFNEDWIEPSELPVESSRVEQRLKALKITAVDQATSLVEKSKELKAEAPGEYSGELTADAAKTFFQQLGRRAAEATEAKGTVKFWTKDGRLTKYEFTVQGKITVGSEKKEVDVSRTTSVEIKDVGSTKITLPEAARNRLS